MGLTDNNGVIAGNTYDKYGSNNFIARKLVDGFRKSLLELIEEVNPHFIHEFGCGEGHWVRFLVDRGMKITGSDVSPEIVEVAKAASGGREHLFKTGSAYSFVPEDSKLDLVLMLETLEHLDRPEQALAHVASLNVPWLICSVPNEPLWSILNLCRGKYLRDLGNTPGHVQRFNRRSFTELLTREFEVKCLKTPVPWLMVLCHHK